MTSPPLSTEPTVQFGILGSVRIAVDGREVALASSKQRALLSRLLIDVGAVVETGRIADVLWGDDQPDDPARAIRTHISRLRGMLRDRGGERAATVLVTRPRGYALAIDPERVDAVRFERLVDAARRSPSPRVRADLTDEALALWRGSPLPELDHSDAITETARLEGLREEARELRAGALLALGRFPEVVADMAALVERHPLREQPRGHLMVALYRSGRQADALAAYQDLRDTLVGELGVEPSAALRRLETAILQQVDDLPWPAPPPDSRVAVVRPTASGGRTSAPSNLPPELTSVVGRDDDVRALAAGLREHHVVVLTGVGGVGKSRLALRLAHEVVGDYPDGVVWCDLVGADSDRAVSDVVASALGALPVPIGGSEDGVEDGDPVDDGLVDVLIAQHALVVLDNCEHVVTGASDLVDRITRRCPNVHVLATSRQPLRTAAQQIRPVTPLDVSATNSACVELFGERAASADPTFHLTEVDREVVAEICRRLDGLPLAVELAAARVRSMNPADILDRLVHRSDTLAGAPGSTPTRHRSLDAVLDWSYELLPDPSRRFLDRLAVFSGGFTHEAAMHVCAGEGVSALQVADRLTDLVEQSLLSVDRSDRYARYRLLETVRAYGEAHLRAGGDLHTWHRLHAEHFVSLAEDAAVGLRGPGEAHWVRVIDTELANLRAAHSWACSTGHVGPALRLASLLGVYAYQRLHGEVQTWALQAVGLPGASEHADFPAALVAAAVGRVQRGDLDRARSDAETVLAMATDEHVVLRAEQLLAEISLYQGRLEETDRRGQELVERSRSVDDPYHEALGHLYRVHAAAYSERFLDVGGHLSAGWLAVATAGTPTLRAGYLYLEGEIRVDADPETARSMLLQAIETAETVRSRFVAGVARVALASVEARHGRPDTALTAFREIVDHWRTSADRVHLWTTLRNVIVLFERIGAAEAAAVLHGAVLSAATGVGVYGADAERLAAAAAANQRTLGASAFAAAEARGKAMPDEEVVTFTLTEIDRLLEDLVEEP